MRQEDPIEMGFGPTQDDIDESVERAERRRDLTDRKELVAKALAEKTILKALNEAHDRTRAELAQLFVDPGDREVGKLLDHRLGTVSLEAGRESWHVYDEQLFLEWVQKNYPTEIVSTVRPSFCDTVLARCRAGGFVDQQTGEVQIPGGIAPRRGAPFLVERTDKQASWVIRDWLGDTAEKLGIEAP